MAAKKQKNFPMFSKATDENATPAKKRKASDPLTILTWNVSGLRACVKKDGAGSIEESGADIIFLQETKCSEWPPEIQRLQDYGYKKLLVSKQSNGGYAGVGLLAREKPLKVEEGLTDSGFEDHARMITAEYENCFIVGVYVPNSGVGLVNLAKRHVWEEKMRAKLKELDKKKPVILVGDLNVAHEEIDLANPESNRNKTAGFTDQERNDFTELLAGGFVDVYRRLNPEQTGAYTYWSYRTNARARNTGWRLDYFVVSERIFEKVQECNINSDVTGSDHCPLTLKIDI